MGVPWKQLTNVNMETGTTIEHNQKANCNILHLKASLEKRLAQEISLKHLLQNNITGLSSQGKYYLECTVPAPYLKAAFKILKRFAYVPTVWGGED